MIRQTLIWLASTVMIPAATVLAVESHNAEAPGGHSGEPDIFSGNLGTAIFTLAIFIVLLLILRKWAWEPILTGLQKREEHIRHSIEEAEKAHSNSEKALAGYQQQLAQAQNEAQVIIEKGRTDALRLAEELKQKAQDEAQSLRAQAERDIDVAKDQALKQICQQTTELATDIAATIIGKNLNSEDHHALLQESLNMLQQNARNF